MQLLTTSRLRAWRSCKKLHHYRYNLRRLPISRSESAWFGTLFHHGLEAWWIAAQDTPTLKERWLDEAMIAVQKTWATDPNGSPFELARVEETVRGYHWRWCDESIRVHGVEVEFGVPLVNPETGASSRTYLRAGKMDAIGETADGAWVIEHKTTVQDVSPGSEYYQRLAMDDQVSAYFAGARALGIDVVGCLYDIAVRPTQKPLLATPVESRKYTKDGRLYANQRDADEDVESFRLRVREAIAERPDHYYSRGTVVRLAHEIEEYQREVWLEAKAMRQHEIANIHPRNPGACQQYGRLCQYFSVCVGQASIDDDLTFRTEENQHSELSAHIQKGAA